MIKEDTTTPEDKIEDIEQTVEVESVEETIEVESAEETVENIQEDYKRKYLHLLADSENARKRLQKDKDEIVQYSIRSILLDFINPIDQMENALKFTKKSSSDVQNWAKGFEMILAQFKDVLANNNVKSYTSVGQVFDPHLHDAIETKETEDHPPGVVVEESTKGYMMGEKVLRPARVVVSKELTDETIEQSKNNKENK